MQFEQVKNIILPIDEENHVTLTLLATKKEFVTNDVPFKEVLLQFDKGVTEDTFVEALQIQCQTIIEACLKENNKLDFTATNKAIKYFVYTTFNMTVTPYEISANGFYTVMIRLVSAILLNMLSKKGQIEETVIHKYCLFLCGYSENPLSKAM